MEADYRRNANLDGLAEFWSRRTGRKVSREDAAEISRNLVGFFKVLLEWDSQERAAAPLEVKAREREHPQSSSRALETEGGSCDEQEAPFEGGRARSSNVEAVSANTPPHDIPLPPTVPGGLMIDGFAMMPEKNILNGNQLASILGVTTRTLRRMVIRNEVPPPIRLAGNAAWLAGHVLAHFEAAAEQARHEAEREARRIRQLSP